ncbi:MFS transporter [Paenibacillus silvae]|uniref:MFS transporter n=1 Tax=Paenibacillus silvae TaxID=1325358 RepID=A0A2W6NN05_9BACL|nr:MFS transporter [Paenibacillus silvae]PZT56588.1 MFS transporter [Paenibacillus silvae]
MNKRYVPTSVGLYVNYFLYGMVNIMLASHMDLLTRDLHTDAAGISMLVSAMGLGRLFTLYISGVLSDKWGRKPFVVAAGVLMALFLIGIPFSPNLGVAVIFAVLAGVSNAMLDSGTYPALIEAFPRTTGSATVLVRGVISAGAAILPIMIVFLMNQGISYKFSFFLPAAVFLLNAYWLHKQRFPDMNANTDPSDQPHNSCDNSGDTHDSCTAPKFWKEGICLILLGFTGPSLLYIMQLWLPTYGQTVIGLNHEDALKLFSYYNIGSLVSIGVLVAILGRFIKPVHVILLYPCISLLAFVGLLFMHSPLAAIINALLIGFSISGVLQLALTVMSEFFGKRKGQATGFIYTATSLAYTTIPFLTGLLLKYEGISAVITLAIGLNLAGIGLAFYINIRYMVVFGKKKPGALRLSLRPPG